MLPHSAKLLLSVVVLCTGCAQEEIHGTAEIRPVKTISVAFKEADEVRGAVGEIRPRNETDLSFRVSGKVIERLVDVGSPVRKGELLARLDDQDYQNRLRSAEADVAAAQAALDEASAAENRMRILLDKGYTTRSNYDGVLKNLRSAKAKLVSAKAAENLARDQLAYTELRADFDGVATATGVESGQIVNVGQMVVRVADPALIDAVFSIAEMAFAGIPAEALNEVDVALLGHPDIVATGRVREIAPVADAATRTFQVKVTLADVPRQMRFGSSVMGRPQVAPEIMAVLPGSALFESGGRPAVWVVDTSSQVELKPIVVASYAADRVMVREGLEEGEIVVTAGVNRLRERQKVRLIDQETRQPPQAPTQPH